MGMNRGLDIFALLRRGGEMNAAEVEQLSNELTEGKLCDMLRGFGERSFDQPVKVVPAELLAPAVTSGYFTQEKFILGKTPEEMEMVLGIFGKLRSGAHILQFKSPLRSGDYGNRAYTYLPGGKEYVPDPNEKVYLPGKGAPQWELTRPVEAVRIATLRPGQRWSAVKSTGS